MTDPCHTTFDPCLRWHSIFESLAPDWLVTDFVLDDGGSLNVRLEGPGKVYVYTNINDPAIVIRAYVDVHAYPIHASAPTAAVDTGELQIELASVVAHAWWDVDPAWRWRRRILGTNPKWPR